MDEMQLQIQSAVAAWENLVHHCRYVVMILHFSDSSDLENAWRDFEHSVGKQLEGMRVMLDRCVCFDETDDELSTRFTRPC
jgi:hypothetical protein